MGNCKSCIGNRTHEFDADSEPWGLSDEGCTQNFHYHLSSISCKNIKLDMYDKILRESLYPLYLLDIGSVWKQLLVFSENHEEYIDYNFFI